MTVFVREMRRAELDIHRGMGNVQHELACDDNLGIERN
jgi:hypothetical protein